MEWVETVGRSIQEAKEAALDQLGVDASEAEFEIIADAQVGLFGRVRSEARVRARVTPRTPRTKEDRRDRRRRSAPKQAQGDSPPTAETSVGDHIGGPPTPVSDASTDEVLPSEPTRPVGYLNSTDEPPPAATPSAFKSAASKEPAETISTKGPEVEVDLEQQGEVATKFLVGLLEKFGLDASVTVRRPDDDTVEIQIEGHDLGILIGPKGATLLALQTLTRTAVFNQTSGSNGHIYVDVSGYRAKRAEALARFATQVAEQVRQSGKRVVLEAMPPPDRKVIHDTITAIDGVHTISDGEEPNRRVVVVPD